MKVILFKAILNLIVLGIGLLHFGEAKRDIKRELPKWFCYLEMILSYATMLFSFTIWFV